MVKKTVQKATEGAQKGLMLAKTIRRAAYTFARFTEECAGIVLRPYQAEAGQAVLDSIRLRRGDSIVVMMSRQSGKDELCANLKAYLLARFAHYEASIVEVNPTYKPQTMNAIDRLDQRLTRNLLTRIHWRKQSQFVRAFGRARVTFLSGATHANVVGATASLLLIVNEAQDIEPASYDRKLAPMAASTNATRLFMGTAWTRNTLLSRELRQALEAEQWDGRRRVFRYDADDVRRLVPAYGEYVDGEIRRLGRTHPLVMTQYFNEEIDAQAGMFNAGRMALIFGSAADGPTPQGVPSATLGDASRGQASTIFGEGSRNARGSGAGRTYAFLIDVAGMEEASANGPTPDPSPNRKSTIFGEGSRSSVQSGRDATTLSVVEIDLSSLETLQAPTYRVVQRAAWTGANHLAVFGQLQALAERWSPQHIVIDATGVGEGLWAMLDRAWPGKVIPVKFNAASKSEIGYRFLAIIETGRFRDATVERDPTGIRRAQVEEQYRACEAVVLTGPQKTMRWGVPEGMRNQNGEMVHDDFVLADALVAALDRLEWSIRFETVVIPAKDPLEEMSKFK